MVDSLSKDKFRIYLLKERPDLAELENINALPTLVFYISGTRTRCITGASNEAIQAIGAFGVSK